MSVRVDSFADTLYRSTSPLDANNAYTIMAWIRPTLMPGSGVWHSVMAAGVDSGSGYDWIELYSNDGVTSQFHSECFGTTNTENPGSTNVALNTWYHIALVREDQATLKMYINGVQEATTITDSVAGRAATIRGPSFGGWFGSDHANQRIAAAKVWTAGISIDAIQREMYSIRPTLATSANLWAWYPMFPGAAEYVKDYSGNGRDLTTGGTLVDEDPPPISYGAPVWAVTTFPSVVVSDPFPAGYQSRARAPQSTLVRM